MFANKLTIKSLNNVGAFRSGAGDGDRSELFCNSSGRARMPLVRPDREAGEIPVKV